MNEQNVQIPFDSDFDQVGGDDSITIKFKLDKQTVFDGLSVIFLFILIYYGWQINSLSKLIN